MPTDEGNVTEVGVGNIQFYVPTAVSGHEDCVFDPGDEFVVATIPDGGLVFYPPEQRPTAADFERLEERTETPRK